MRLGSWFASGAFPFSDQHILYTTRRPFSDGGEPLAASISEQPPQLRLSNAIYRFFLDRPVSSSGVPFDSCERSSRAFAVCSLPARLSFWPTLLKQLPVLASIVTQSRRQICGQTRFSLLARAHPW